MLRVGDIVFVRGHMNDVVDDCIKLGEEILDKTPFAKNYTHVCVYVGGNTVMEAQGFRKSGETNIGDYSGDYDIGHVEGMTYFKVNQLLAALDDENGLPYDWPGIWWLIIYILTRGRFGKRYHERRKRYCSEYVAWAFKQIGIELNGRTPEDLALDKLIRIEKG